MERGERAVAERERGKGESMKERELAYAERVDGYPYLKRVSERQRERERQK